MISRLMTMIIDNSNNDRETNSNDYDSYSYNNDIKYHNYDSNEIIIRTIEVIIIMI